MRSGSRPKVFGAGLIALDVVASTDPTMPLRCFTGGTCGNVLSILAFLGWDAYPVARINGDAASDCVFADLKRWGVHLDWINCAPTTHAPIIVQEIRRRSDGRPKHRFSRLCPNCGAGLPRFKAITLEAVERVRSAIVGCSVFFLDRLSRATLALAAEASALGALVVFEPSGRGNQGHMAEAIELAHVVKYAADRLAAIPGAMGEGSATLLEVRTLGAQGLKYRHRLDRGASNWNHLAAIPAPRLADTCGSGDWCSAGLIAQVAAAGQEGLRRAGANGVRAALHYGQTLAAWNCGFEGARGGMYAVSPEIFKDQIRSLIEGEIEKTPNPPVESILTGLVPCPACPPVPE